MREKFEAEYGFPEGADRFSISGVHFFLSEEGYAGFCVAMGRLAMVGIEGDTFIEVFEQWDKRELDRRIERLLRA